MCTRHDGAAPQDRLVIASLAHLRAADAHLRRYECGSEIASVIPGHLRLPRSGVAVSASLAILAGVACSSAAVATTPAPATATAPPSATVPPAPTTRVSSAAVATRDEPHTTDDDSLGPALSISRELNPSGPKFVDPRSFRQLLGRDAIRPIYDPVIAAPNDVQLGPKELVLGVSIVEESRAYPVRTLRFREMVNNELGSIPILVTW